MKRLLLALLLFTSLHATPVVAQQLGDEKMADANAVAATVVKERMRTTRPRDFQLLKEVEKAEIIVVRGTYDRVEDVLTAVEIQHLVIDPLQLDTIELNAKQLVIVNCPGSLSEKGIVKIRKFVKAGGFLYTTDWALLAVQRAFPGYIEFNGVETENDVVAVRVRKKDNVFLQHLSLSKSEPKWWLEDSSYPIKVLRDDVEVLIGSAEMKKKYGESAVAVTFPYGDGRVLHIASHFYLQQNETRTATEAKAATAWLEQDSDLPDAVAKKVAASTKSGKASGGDVNSAYSAQQMTTNIVVERKKDQKRIDALYSKEMKREEQGLKSGDKVRVVKKKAKKALVRDMQGNEAWVPSDAVQ